MVFPVARVFGLLRLRSRVLRPAACPTRLRLFSTHTTGAAPSPQPSPVRIVSGIQPSGVMHLGNYLGAVQSWQKLQNGTFHTPTPKADTEHKGTTATHAPTPSSSSVVAAPAADPSSFASSAPKEMFLFLADWHALTVRPNPNELRESCLSLTAQLLACGIDPGRSTLFQQSHVREHLELGWIFSCLTPFSRLHAMTQFKDKSAKLKDNKEGPGGHSTQSASLGLFSYPVLQAADILLYRATAVPVGQDQFQHVELCRDIATYFNNHARAMKDTSASSSSSSSSSSGVPLTFPLPQHLSTPTPRVMSLRTGTTKMSKSDPVDASRINLTDTPDQIRKKIQRCLTDSIVGPLTYDEEARPQVANLLRILSALADRPIPALLADRHVSGDVRDLKRALADELVRTIDPIRQEYARLIQDEGHLHSVLARGADKARQTAQETMRHVNAIVGVR